MKKTSVEVRYYPRPHQQEIHDALRVDGKRIRFACLAIHRRFGKSVFAIAELIHGALTCPLKNGRFFYLAPTMKQARSIVWDYAKDMLQDIPDMKFYETDLRIEFPNGSRIQLSGATEYTVLRGNYMDGVVIDEWGNMAEGVWSEVIRPALADRYTMDPNMGWCIFLGTPNGKNHFYSTMEEAKRTEGWLARSYSATQTGIIPAEELAVMEMTMGSEAFRQEMLVDWSAGTRGSYYGAEMSRVREEGRMLNIPLARALPCDLSFDLGMDDATSIFIVQCVAGEIRLLRYAEWTNTSLLDILDELRRPPYDQYRYGTCFLPHDAEVRSFNDGKTRTETMENSLMFEDVVVTPRLPVEDGVNAVRQMLPRCYFDKHHASLGVDCLDNYRKQHDPKTGVYKNTPVHDRWSNGADSMRMLAVNYHPRMGDTQARGRIAKIRTDHHRPLGEPQVHTQLKANRRTRGNINSARY